MEKIVTGASASSAPGTRKAPPATLVIFGAAGDLAKRLLFPSLYNLAGEGLLDDETCVLGLDIAAEGEEAWKRVLTDTVQSFVGDMSAEFHPAAIDAETWSWLMGRAHYERADFTDPATFAMLKNRIGDGSAVFYLAVPGRFFGPIVQRIADAGLFAEPQGHFRRLVVEKPFGSDLTSAQALNKLILDRAREDQVFRIDHFMGKEAVQSLLAMRFGNAIFEPLCRAEYVDRVEITASEVIGVEGRGRFYEPTGAIRDMVPNHLFQLLCMVAMDPPPSLDPEDIRGEKTRLLRAVRPLGADDVVLGQYGAGQSGGRAVLGYRDEPDVAAGSQTETFVAARLRVENWRWAGTPFFIRTGKRMPARRTEIVIRLKPAPFALFADVPSGLDTPDQIVLAIDPSYEVEIAFDVKRPGPAMQLAKAAMRFDAVSTFPERPNVGYEALLYDCLLGDATLFQRADTIEASWAVVDPILGGPARPAIESYAAGTAGPDAAARLNPKGWRDLG